MKKIKIDGMKSFMLKIKHADIPAMYCEAALSKIEYTNIPKRVIITFDAYLVEHQQNKNKLDNGLK